MIYFWFWLFVARLLVWVFWLVGIVVWVVFAFNSVVIVISLFCGEFLLDLSCWVGIVLVAVGWRLFVFLVLGMAC